MSLRRVIGGLHYYRCTCGNAGLRLNTEDYGEPFMIPLSIVNCMTIKELDQWAKKKEIVIELPHGIR